MTELLVVVALMSMMLGVVYLVMLAVGQLSDGAVARAIAADEAQRFVDRIGRELRQAQEWDEDKGAFAEIAVRKIVFYTDTDADAIPERVTYYVQDGAVYRTQATTTKTVMPFNTWGSDSTPEMIVSKIDPTWADALFTYYDTGNTAVSASAQMASISRVDVAIRVRAESRERYAVVPAAITARLRSVQNSLGGS
jgi:hypothetical protein